MKHARKTVNLADRKAAMEALKQLYGKEVKDGRFQTENTSTNGEAGTQVSHAVDKDSAGCTRPHHSHSK